MTKIVVIGGSGFLGRHLIELLLAKNMHVINVDLAPSALVNERLEFIEASFIEPDQLHNAFADSDIVFHLASTTLPKTSNDNPQFDVQSNLCGTLSLLDLAVKNNIQKFIFISSGGTVYGPPTQLPVPEDHVTNPTCSYGIVKLAIEKYLQMYHHLYGLNTCSLRLSNPYGAYQRVDKAQGAVTVFCHKAVSEETIEIWGDGSVVRDFIYATDAAQAMLATIGAECAGQVINIGNGCGTSLNQLLAIIESALGRKVDKTYLEARGFDVPEIYLDTQKAKQLLGWEPSISIEEGVKLLINTMSTNPQSKEL